MTLTLTCDLKFNRFLEVVEGHVTQNGINLISAVHELSCARVHIFLPYLAMVESPKIWPRDLEILWVLSGCQGTCSCKILLSYVQQFMSYDGYK